MKRLVIIVITLAVIVFSCDSRGTAAVSDTSSEDVWRAFEGTELNVLAFPITYVAGLETQLDEFYDLTGIRVQMDLYSEGVAHDRVRQELSSGGGAYDVVWVQANWSIPYAAQGWIQPLDPLINNSRFTIPEYLELDDVMDSLLELMRYDGQLYGLPFFAATIMTYYRADVLEQHGIAPEQLDTIEGLVAAVKTVHSNDIAGISLRGHPGESSWHSTVFLKGLGGTYVRDIKGGDYFPTFDTPAVIESTTMYADLLRNYSIPGAVNAVFDDVVIAMQQGNAAIVIEGAPLGGRILHPDESRVRGLVGFRPVPEGPGGRHPAFTGHGFALNSASRNQEAAWLFMQWSNSFEVTKKIALSSNHIAVHRESLWSDPDFRDRWNLPGHGDFLATFQQSLAVADPDYRPRIQGWVEVNDVYGAALQSVILGQETAEQAMRRVQAEAIEILRRHRWIE